EAVEAPPLQQLRQVGPVGELAVVPGAVLGVPPEAGRLVGDAVHVEGVEADRTGHQTGLFLALWGWSLGVPVAYSLVSRSTNKLKGDRMMRAVPRGCQIGISGSPIVFP